MKNIPDRTDTSSVDSSDTVCGSACAEAGPSNRRSPKSSLWSGFLVSSFLVFDTHSESRCCPKKNQENSLRNHGWTAALKRVMNGSSMRRLHERVLGYKCNISNSISDIWLLGVCYKICPEEAVNTNGYAAFSDDFSSRILVTYRKGFVSIGDSKYTSDVNWGCMLRSSQMLVAQALLIHRLGRSWRKPAQQPADQDYIEILHMFGDSEDSAFSIHNLLKAGEGYALAPGSWVGPYAMCRTWETLARRRIAENELEGNSFPMAIYVVSGDEDGERGGAPVLCIEDALRHCSEFSRGQVEWSPMLLLVPLVLGLDKVNPRYLPLLAATFIFPQSLGILGGRPGASTYLIGVQDDKVFYLDPHEVQQAVNISRDNLEADTSSYHCNVIRQIPFDSIDPSLAIGFYCRDKDDFDDFCSRAFELAAESDGAPLFTITRARNSPRSSNTNRDQEADLFEAADDAEGCAQDDWQLL
ncbi:LOW QUALITY PROTEIN: cysteine protease ATG4-like [Rutidosis leptorrhynchoides]|uniref:LOW QUALITY PROTEIN: cysteine protease ATG4-like n=1 Tax=Rutidosis leptorrhynchoides TaxID=125765 RepID=UPI003A99B79A